MKERAVFGDGTAHGRRDAIAAEVWPAGRGFERIVSIERAILDVDIGVSVDDVCAGARHDVDGTPGSAAVFRREPIVHHLILLDVLRRKLCAARTSIFIVVVEPGDGDIVVCRAKAADAEAT